MTSFDAAAATWDENPERRQRSLEIANSILGYAQLTSQAEVLELGCGSGVIALALCTHVRNIIAADMSSAMLQVVQSKMQREEIPNLTTHLLQGTPGEPLPACDAVVSSMMLHHIDDVPELLQRIFTALRPGGKLALADLDCENGLFHPDPEGVFHNGFEHQELTHWLECAGFVQVSFFEASRMKKIAADGIERIFSIFLVVAHKPL